LPRFFLLAVIGATTAGCGGAAPLMHTAHALAEDDFTLGGGFSGTLPVDPPVRSETADQVMEGGAFAPGLAPWVGARYGLGNHFDAGLTYTGRSIRLDGRRAWHFGEDEQSAVSLGIAASGLLPKRDDDLGFRVGGFGGDVPLLIGWRSTGDIYSVWAGPRGGIELLRGQRDLEGDPADPLSSLVEDVDGWHAQVGGLVGVRVGFRYIFAVFEVGAAMHWAQGDVGSIPVSIRQFSVAPSGALVGSF
jgi:hypothetical protein